MTRKVLVTWVMQDLRYSPVIPNLIGNLNKQKNPHHSRVSPSFCSSSFSVFFSHMISCLIVHIVPTPSQGISQSPPIYNHTKTAAPSVPPFFIVYSLSFTVFLSSTPLSPHGSLKEEPSARDIVFLHRQMSPDGCMSPPKLHGILPAILHFRERPESVAPSHQ